MLQLEPNNRLGHDLESIEILKQHPFFTGIDWVAISSRKYKGVMELLKQKVDDGIKNGDNLDYNYFHEFVPSQKFEKKASTVDEKGIMIKGHL